MKIAIHSVFIVKENILFLEEWIDYNIQLGVDHFYLYDNSKVNKVVGFDANKKHMIPGKINKYNINYDEVVKLTTEQIDDILNRIKNKYNGIVEIIEWSRKDKNGNICYFQKEAQNHCLNMLKKKDITWCANIDLDEFIVLKQGDLKTYISSLKNDISCITLSQFEFESRFDNIGKPIVSIDKMKVPIPITSYAPKYIYKVRNTNEVSVHSCKFNGKAINPDRKIICFNHYKIHYRDSNQYKIVPVNINDTIVSTISSNFNDYFVNNVENI